MDHSENRGILCMISKMVQLAEGLPPLINIYEATQPLLKDWID